MGTNLIQEYAHRISKTPSGCWQWTGYRSQAGYGVIHRRGRSFLTHRLAYEAAHGAIPQDAQVLHKCDNPRCVRPDHLEVGSVRKNIRDAVRRGLIKVGEQSPSSKLSAQEVSEIRMTYATGGVSLRALAAKFGVNHKTIHKIISGRTWVSAGERG
jgi:hypothetical protein